VVLRVLLFIAILFAVLFALRQALLAVRGKRRPQRRSRQDRAIEDARQRLGVDAGASQDEIRAAFRAKAARAHPDAGGDAVGWRALVRARDLLLSKADRTTRRD
jgi:DnaJ-domain-containing protein 1